MRFKFGFCIYVLLISTVISGQSLTTYYTDFDTPAARNGWTQYRKGSLALNGWVFNLNAYTTPTCLAHYYPVAVSAPTDDWFVSPVFNFSAGGKIDSLRFNFSGFGTPQSLDTIAIFLLVGSADPAQASARFKLFEFRGADYVNDDIWKVKSNINIPAKNGLCYLAFKYYTGNSNWLDVKYDNIRIKINSTVGTKETEPVGDKITIYPNPVANLISFKNNGDLNGNLNGENLSLLIYNSLGQEVSRKSVNFNEKTTLELTNGIYLYKLHDGHQKLIKSGRIFVKNE